MKRHPKVGCPVCHLEDLLQELVRIHPYLRSEVEALMVWVHHTHQEMGQWQMLSALHDNRIKSLTKLAAKAEKYEHELAQLRRKP